MIRRTHDLTVAVICLALAQLLPFITGQIPQIAAMLSPMHIPILLCGFICTPRYAFKVGLIAPILRFILFGMPPLFPVGIAMSFELATYGVIAAILYRKYSIYFSLIMSMLAGRVVWGLTMTVIAGVSQVQFGIGVFWTSAFVTGVSGIILQLVFIPILVKALKKTGVGYESFKSSKQPV